jgi:nucleotide-binding universal stress UspA family protein
VRTNVEEVTHMMELRNILVPVDFSESAKEAAAHASFLAGQTGANVHLLHVVELGTTLADEIPEDVYETERERAYERLTATLWRNGDARTGELTVRPASREMHTVDVILEQAEATSADVIVMGTHGRRGLRRMVLGSVAEEVSRRALCPVMLIREPEESCPLPEVSKILVPLDFSDYSESAIDAARTFARIHDAGLWLLNVVEIGHYPHYGVTADPVHVFEQNLLNAANDRLQAYVDELREDGFRAHAAALSGRAGEAIVRYASTEAVDLVVLASHGRTGAERFLLGSVAERVIRTADCPVCVVRVAPVPA